MDLNPSQMPGHSAVRAVLLDVMGTLVELEPPAELLRAALRERLGIVVSARDAADAMRAEISLYRAHHLEGSDAAGLLALRRLCAATVQERLPALAGAPPAAVLDALLSALRFRAHPDATPALRSLRSADRRLVAVSNWDVSLHEVLERTGLAPLVDGAVSSAEAGAAKPGRAIFERALELAGGVSPDEALHVGDSPVEDVAGARAAGIRPVLLVRRGAAAPGVPSIGSLRELAGLVGRPA